MPRGGKVQTSKNPPLPVWKLVRWRDGTGQTHSWNNRTGRERGRERGVLGYTPTLEDLRLKEVYGDWVHNNSGDCLHGGISDDKVWQVWRHDIAVMPS